MKLAITLLIAAVMPLGLVMLAGVVASRILARYHRQRRSDRRTSGHTGESWVTMLRQSQPVS